MHALLEWRDAAAAAAAGLHMSVCLCVCLSCAHNKLGNVIFFVQIWGRAWMDGKHVCVSLSGARMVAWDSATTLEDAQGWVYECGIVYSRLTFGLYSSASNKYQIAYFPLHVAYVCDHIFTYATAAVCVLYKFISMSRFSRPHFRACWAQQHSGYITSVARRFTHAQVLRTAVRTTSKALRTFINIYTTNSWTNRSEERRRWRRLRPCTKLVFVYSYGAMRSQQYNLKLFRKCCTNTVWELRMAQFRTWPIIECGREHSNDNIENTSSLWRQHPF